MRLQLSDGSYIETNSPTPSKRQVKHKGGSLKRNSSRNTLKGLGSSSVTKAIYKDFITDPETGEVVISSLPVELCIVVDAAKRVFTTDLGGSCSTGYIGGRGV